MATMTTILIPPTAADSPAQLAAAVSLPTGVGTTPPPAHLRAEVGPTDSYDYPDQYYGGPARSPICVSIPPPADGLPRRARAVCYVYTQDGEDILDTSIPVTICWPEA